MCVICDRCLHKAAPWGARLPLCRGHHRELHRCGDEGAWWRKAGLEPTAAARALWRKTHPLSRPSPMTSVRQFQANRRNGRHGTGPTSDEGKQRSRCNAMCHGLTAETMIGALEDAEDYKAFEAAITADYDAQSAAERELVLRLASLLWRLRRATAIETGYSRLRPTLATEFGSAMRWPAPHASWSLRYSAQANRRVATRLYSRMML
jgi:hypothetical protein